MSSAIYLKFAEPVKLAEWLSFCQEHEIIYSPNTVGQNVFYHGGMGGTEITFGKSNFKDLPRLPSGSIDFSKATPCETASKINVSTFFMGSLSGVAKVAKEITARWPCEFECDPELADLMGRPEELTAFIDRMEDSGSSLCNQLGDALKKRRDDDASTDMPNVS